MRRKPSPQFRCLIERVLSGLSGTFRINILAALTGLLVFAATAPAQTANDRFVRVATFPVFLNTCDGQPAECIDETTVSEIVQSGRYSLTSFGLA